MPVDAKPVKNLMPVRHSMTGNDNSTIGTNGPNNVDGEEDTLAANAPSPMTDTSPFSNSAGVATLSSGIIKATGTTFPPAESNVIGSKEHASSDGFSKFQHCANGDNVVTTMASDKATGSPSPSLKPASATTLNPSGCQTANLGWSWLSSKQGVM